MSEQAVDLAPPAERAGLRRRLPNPRHALLLPLALLMVTPLLWMLMTSIQTPDEARRFPPVLPSGIHWQNYTDALHAAHFGRFFFNTALGRAKLMFGMQ